VEFVEHVTDDTLER
jgi:hypothetical protein